MQCWWSCINLHGTIQRMTSIKSMHHDIPNITYLLVRCHLYIESAPRFRFLSASNYFTLISNSKWSLPAVLWLKQPVEQYEKSVLVYPSSSNTRDNNRKACQACDTPHRPHTYNVSRGQSYKKSDLKNFKVCSDHIILGVIKTSYALCSQMVMPSSFALCSQMVMPSSFPALIN